MSEPNGDNMIRIKVYAVVLVFLAISRWTNSLPDPDLRNMLGTALLIASIFVLEWILITVGRAARCAALRALANRYDPTLYPPPSDEAPQRYVRARQ